MSLMDVALLRTNWPGYVWVFSRKLAQEISYFGEIFSAHEEQLFGASVSGELHWAQAETDLWAIPEADLEAVCHMLTNVRPISSSLGLKALLRWLWLWCGVHAAWATRH